MKIPEDSIEYHFVFEDVRTLLNGVAIRSWRRRLISSLKENVTLAIFLLSFWLCTSLI